MRSGESTFIQIVDDAQKNKGQHTSLICKHQCVFSQCPIKSQYTQVVSESILSVETQLSYRSSASVFSFIFQLTSVRIGRFWNILPTHIYACEHTSALLVVWPSQLLCACGKDKSSMRQILSATFCELTSQTSN